MRSAWEIALPMGLPLNVAGFTHMFASDRLLDTRPDGSRRQLDLALRTLDSCREILVLTSFG